MSGEYSLFVYGTLQDERVMRAVTGKVFTATPATLQGYCRYRVKQADYPGIVTDAAGSVQGLLLSVIDPDALDALDKFEGEYYERIAVRATADNTEYECYVYVIASTWLHILSDEAWTLEEFQRTGYQRFRDTYPNF